MRTADPHAPTKESILDAAVVLMLKKGYTATSVDEICAAAGATKGSFFHFFKNKEDLAKAAVERFSRWQMELFQSAPYNRLADPLDRFLGMLDFIVENFQNPKLVKSCLVGNISQELAPTQPRMQAACCEAFERVGGGFTKLLAEAKARHKPVRDFDPVELSDYFTSVIQGSMILMKAQGGPAVGVSNIRQFKRHVEALFGRA